MENFTGFVDSEMSDIFNKFFNNETLKNYGSVENLYSKIFDELLNLSDDSKKYIRECLEEKNLTNVKKIFEKFLIEKVEFVDLLNIINSIRENDSTEQELGILIDCITSKETR